MDGALALVDKTLKEGGFETDATLQIMMTRAVILAQQKKLDEALKAVDEAKAFAPDSPMMPSIDGSGNAWKRSRKKASEPPAKEEPKEDAQPADDK